MTLPEIDATRMLMAQAIALHRAGRSAEAVGAYRNLLAVSPQTAEGHANLGNLLSAIGRHDEAIASCGTAVALRPDVPEAHYNLGNALKSGGRMDEARVSYQKALSLRPNFPAALFNLGNVFTAQGQIADATAAFMSATALQPNFAQAHNNLGILRFQAADYIEARQSFELALEYQPQYSAAHNNLGMALQKMGQFGDAENCFRTALHLQPDYPEALEQLGAILLETRRTEEAFETFRLLASRQAAASNSSPLHKVRHDAEQSAYIARQASRGEKIGRGDRISGSTINPVNDAEAIERQWQAASPQILVIDDLLTCEALDGLRRFCLDADIWNEVFDNGYLGTKLQSGFACPLVAQLAQDLASRYPAIFLDHPLLFAWAFKYDQNMRGIKVHADFAAVNVNFWITPDSANRNPERGGVIVWDRAAPQDWDFKRYNADETAIRDFLRNGGAKPTRIPYRANRAVIFDSDLFHETDEMSFSDGYENRRINITLLYGVRESSK